ncbi:MAG: Uma2 family endonuclease [Lewinellaceae bacterium]|nr:Uma2 family endonuclease [Lewinellaceae bacterium]
MVDTLISPKRYSLEEYFALEEKAEEKHEFHNGKIKTMPGGTIPHNKIAVNIITILNSWVADNYLPYVVLNSDTKLRIEHFNSIVYPDVLMVCEKLEYWKGRKDTILNPKLVFEVASESTEDYDRGNKFNLYRSLPSFQEYVMISQYRPMVESHFLQSAEESLWKITTANGLDASLHLKSIGFDLPLAKVYRQVPELQGEDWEG